MELMKEFETINENITWKDFQKSKLNETDLNVVNDIEKLLDDTKKEIKEYEKQIRELDCKIKKLEKVIAKLNDRYNKYIYPECVSCGKQSFEKYCSDEECW